MILLIERHIIFVSEWNCYFELSNIAHFPTQTSKYVLTWTPNRFISS